MLDWPVVSDARPCFGNKQHPIHNQTKSQKSHPNQRPESFGKRKPNGRIVRWISGPRSYQGLRDDEEVAAKKVRFARGKAMTDLAEQCERITVGGKNGSRIIQASPMHFLVRPKSNWIVALKRRL